MPQTVFSKVESLLEKFQPFQNLNTASLRYDLQGWNSERLTLRKMLEQTRPGLVIEVGSWKGASAIFMGRYIKEKQWNAKIVCVDSWDQPAIFQQFVFNVAQSQLTDILIPFPQTSMEAASWFRENGVLADLIYIDAGHKEKDVYQDVKNYYGLLKPEGIIFGDDYFEGEPGLMRAVKRFAGEIGKKISVEENQFWILGGTARP